MKKNDNSTIKDKFSTPHKRDFFELTILIRNSGTINIGERSIENVKSSLAIISPFQVVSINKIDAHAKDYINKTDIDGFVILFKHSFFTSINQPSEIQNEFPFFRIHTAPFYELSPIQLSDIINIAEQMYDESKHAMMNNTEIVRSLLLILLYRIKRITLDNQSVVNVNRFEAITSRFEQTIIANNGTFLSVSEYASRLNISAIYLSECVKKATAKSAQKVIIDYKILYTKSLLQQTDKPVTAIAYELGFMEASNFTKFFKRNTGITPKQFRSKRN